MSFDWVTERKRSIQGLEHVWGRPIVWCTLTGRSLVSLLPVSIIHVSDIFLVGFWSWEISFIMWGCRGWDLGFGFPWNGRIPCPHRVTWSQPINMRPVKSPRAPKFEQKPAKFVPIGLLCKHVAREVCINRTALQTCNQSLCNPYVICW